MSTRIDFNYKIKKFACSARFDLAFVTYYLVLSLEARGCFHSAQISKQRIFLLSPQSVPCMVYGRRGTWGRS